MTHHQPSPRGTNAGAAAAALVLADSLSLEDT
jgi:hypothetical protein